MNRKEYRLVPERKTAYEVQENCCYEMTVYEGDNIGIASKMDHYNEVIGPLLCDICDPHLVIKRISRAEYEALREDVKKKRA